MLRSVAKDVLGFVGGSGHVSLDSSSRKKSETNRKINMLPNLNTERRSSLSPTSSPPPCCTSPPHLPLPRSLNMKIYYRFHMPRITWISRQGRSIHALWLPLAPRPLYLRRSMAAPTGRQARGDSLSFLLPSLSIRSVWHLAGKSAFNPATDSCHVRSGHVRPHLPLSLSH